MSRSLNFYKVRSNIVSRTVINNLGNEQQREQYRIFTSRKEFDLAQIAEAKLSKLFIVPLIACVTLLVVFRNLEFHSQTELVNLGHSAYSKMFLILFGLTASLTAHFSVFKLIESRPDHARSLVKWLTLIHDGTLFAVGGWYLIFVMYR